jgi:hypothetical protein
MKITKSQLNKIIFKEIQDMQEIGKSGRPGFEDPQGQKKWKKEREPIEKKHWMGRDDDEEEDPDELDMLGMQFGADEDQMAWAREMEESKLRLTISELKKMILQEITISLSKSQGGCLGEENGVDYDLDMPDEEEEDSHTLGPVPDALTQNRSGMGSISEDGWEDENPYDAPPAGGMPRERPPRQEIDQVIDDIIVDLKRGPAEMPLPDVIALLQHISNIYLGS